ncbi:MAG: terminase family protein [Candidatus Krumholzibacteria bacterium]|nr:terminase family protein [Candidatus Krumholzibacteria bacterium]
MTQPAVQLYDFQKRWLADPSRFKAGCIARQVGKSFIVALEAVLEAARTGVNEIMLSAGERQSKELMEKAKLHTEAMSLAASDIHEDFFADTSVKQLSISLPNGARIIGLPANPATARGFTGNATLDEFAFHQDSAKIWAALFPTVSRGHKLRVVSTPQGRQNKFYSLFTAADNGFTKHFVDIYQAVADGVPHDIDALRKGVDDDDAWQQEYECKFLDEATAWLTYELIASCESDEMPVECDSESLTDAMLAWPVIGPIYIGVDVGRKRDLTIINAVEQLGDVYYSRLILKLNKQPFAVQRRFLWDLIRRLKAVRVCMDDTGLGAQLAEETRDEFGAYRIEPVTFTLAVKNDLATRTRRVFEDRRIRIPVDRALRNDLHSVKKTTTAAGNVRFDAERTADGHADRFWALALALMAADNPTTPEVILL